MRKTMSPDTGGHTYTTGTYISARRGVGDRNTRRFIPMIQMRINAPMDKNSHARSVVLTVDGIGPLDHAMRMVRASARAELTKLTQNFIEIASEAPRFLEALVIRTRVQWPQSILTAIEIRVRVPEPLQQLDNPGLSPISIESRPLNDSGDFGERFDQSFKLFPKFSKQLPMLVQFGLALGKFRINTHVPCTTPRAWHGNKESHLEVMLKYVEHLLKARF